MSYEKIVIFRFLFTDFLNMLKISLKKINGILHIIDIF